MAGIMKAGIETSPVTSFGPGGSDRLACRIAHTRLAWAGTLLMILIPADEDLFLPLKLRPRASSAARIPFLFSLLLRYPLRATMPDRSPADRGTAPWQV